MSASVVRASFGRRRTRSWSRLGCVNVRGEMFTIAVIITVTVIVALVWLGERG
ncbi:MAG TPA: hypothetical protein VFT94_01580 [Gaiellaceae bacterium]|nr:hypothetical protein [Gaiellaceae bacterium]